MTKKGISFLTLFLFLLLLSEVACGQIYLSPTGDDRFKGTKKKPVASFSRAQELARKADKSKPIEVIFKEGTYYLDNEILFTHKDSRPAHAPVTYKAEKEGTVVISGGSKLSLTWKPHARGIYVAEVQGEPIIDQLYVNGVRQRMARFPNAEQGKNIFDRWNLEKGSSWEQIKYVNSDENDDPFDPNRIKGWANPKGGYLHAMHAHLWGGMHWEITGKPNDTTLAYRGGWQNNRPSAMHYRFRFVENIYEELDAPGEWYYDSSTNRLYYMPSPSLQLHKATIEIVRLKSLIEFKGSREAPVSHVHLQGFIFRHVARTFMENKEPLGRSDWTIFRGAALFYDGAVACSTTDCEFDQVGGNAIFVNNYNRNIKIARCYIHDSGASGVLFVGDQRAVRSYLSGYVDQNYEQLDTLRGPATDNYPSDCLVENSIITRIGRDEKQTAAIQISMSKNIHIKHISVYDVPRAGINISEGAFGGHLIEYCDVFNTVLETGDHGSFNSWGRDRFWSPNVKNTSEKVSKRPDMPLWDMENPNIIRNSRWKCEYGWDIDLDDGSSNYLIYNNLLLNGGLKLREGYNRTATNNIIINNGLHPHVWFPNSGDIFKNNIVFKAHQPAVMTMALDADAQWGQEVDYNFYATSENEMKRYALNGCDKNSKNGNPLFIDPLKGDFRVQENSPALEVGFVNFPMDSFGVQHPKLKQIAKTPLLPAIVTAVETVGTPTNQKSYFWFGASLHTPVGEQFSAYGVSFAEGGVALTVVPENSQAAQLGFTSGDLIQLINRTGIKNIADLIDFVEKNGQQNRFEIEYVRNQKRATIVVDRIGEVTD